MKIATWNVNGVRAREGQVVEWLGHEKPDVVCLQETKAPREKVPESLRELPEYWGFWHGFKGYSGVALLVRKEFCVESPEFVHPAFDIENRMVMARVNGVNFLSVYVPNGGRDLGVKLRFLEEMQEFARGFKAAGESLVICGDLNVAHTPMDVHPKERAVVTGQLPMERTALDDILAHDLVDLGRKAAPDDEGLFTWWAPWREMKQRNIGWRLDYIYASGKLAKGMRSCVVEKDVGTSDHAPVVAVVTDR